MNKYIKMISLVTTLTGLLFSAGCVSQAEYQEVLTANRSLRDNESMLKSDIEAMNFEKNELLSDLGKSQDNNRTLNKQVQLSDQQIADLNSTIAKLQKVITDGAATSLPPAITEYLPPQLNAALKAFAKANPDLVDYHPGRGMIKLKSDLTFDLGKDHVKASAQAALVKFAAILNDPAAKGFNIYVAGHTDNVPVVKSVRSHPDNWYLSAHRAIAVQQILVIKAKIDPARVAVLGFGEYQPVSPNPVYKPGTNGKGNVKNRRVELWIVPPSRFLTSEAIKTPKPDSDK